MGTITLSNIGKAYKQYPSRWSRLAEWLSPFNSSYHQLKWVLQDISFTVKPGEAVGIIGINGAGKSTLLKMIVGTTQPSTGNVELTGRVAALLELGMGFHPDFTGRQNVYMAGQLLGISVEEITSLMPDIEAFAEIGDYIDQSVRVYSSGMQMRLAFSLATARRPDVLIVDEALSVGDTYFQHKSFERIREFRKLGTTLLIVSHDKQAIQSICDRAILLNAGRLAKQGDPEEVMDYYNALIAQRENLEVVQIKSDQGRTQTISGTNGANVLELALLNKDGKNLKIVSVGEIVTLRIKVQANITIPRLVLGYLIKDRLGQAMYGTNTHHLDTALNEMQVGDQAEYRFTFPVNLGAGDYSIATALTDSETHLGNNYEWCDLALLFTVVNMNQSVFTGCVWLDPITSLLRK
jgi:lipopolysaccharide transport system ATP-binding protein